MTENRSEELKTVVRRCPYCDKQTQHSISMKETGYILESVTTHGISGIPIKNFIKTGIEGKTVCKVCGLKLKWVLKEGVLK